MAHGQSMQFYWQSIEMVSLIGGFICISYYLCQENFSQLYGILFLYFCFHFSFSGRKLENANSFLFCLLLVSLLSTLTRMLSTSKTDVFFCFCHLFPTLLSCLSVFLFLQNLNKEPTESKWKPAMQGRGGKGGRGFFSSRNYSHGKYYSLSPTSYM